MDSHSLLYILGSTLWTPCPSHLFLSPNLTLHYYFLILLMIVILAGMIVRLEPFVQLEFHIYFEILDTILQLGLMEFVILNE